MTRLNLDSDSHAPAEPGSPPLGEPNASAPQADKLFPIVGVGASAGGLEAYLQLLEALPADTGMGFVLVQHLDPTHASLLSEILARATTMPVLEVRDEPKILPNHVYVIPPNKTMMMTDGSLKLVPRATTRGQHRPIDVYLRSLAEFSSHQAIGVILSGTGTDGTLGLEAIKAESGITFAQDDTAQQSGMPRSAVASGCVDFVMPPDQIAAELARIGRHPYVAPPRPGLVATPGEEPLPDKNISKVLRLIQNVTGVDFTHYKSTTLYRRITRRMLLHKLDGLPEYVRYLQGNADEVQSLYRDILISVTSFFRDPNAFEALKTTIFPQLLKDRPPQDPVRVWVMGCSTGEETYSLAMALTEAAEERGVPLRAQLFATDLNEQGIEKARRGLYAKNIVQDVSPERLRRFFLETEGGYQVSRAIRELCVFARQNVLSDPPFSHMDFISCRNLLIYMEPILQRKVVPVFHYALEPRGFLWLGSSETIGTFTDLFELADPKHKVYARKPGVSTGHVPLPQAAAPWARVGGAPPRRGPSDGQTNPVILREADRLALTRYAPPGVLVNAELDILQFRGDTSAFLAPASGKPSVNVLKMAREGLLVGLRAALQQAIKEGTAVRQEGLSVKTNGGRHEVHLEVLPVHGGSAEERCFLVLFEEVAAAGKPAAETLSGAPGQLVDAELQVTRLTQELAATREYMQALIEQQEAANEELQSANEEIQSSNEELQSINEELQTSKEEIQSSNEELKTVNEELHHRNEQLNQAHNDLANFLASSHLALVMVGPDLRIRRFTPRAGTVLNLLATDVGRSLGDLNLPLTAAELAQALAEVIDTIQAREQEVQDKQGRWYSLRLRPYKTADNRIDGAVLVLVDIDEQKRAQAATQDARAFAESIVATVREPLVVLDSELRVRSASRSFYQTFQMTPPDTEGRPLHQLGNGQWNLSELRRLLDEVLPRDNQLDDFAMDFAFAGGDRRSLLLNARRLRQENGGAALILLALEDVTERKRAEEALKVANHRKDEFLAMLAHELRNPLAPLRHTLEFLRLSEADRGPLKDGREMMERQVHKLTRLVNDLLDVSRIGQGRIELQKQPLDLAALVPLAVEAVQHSIDGQGHALTLSLPPTPLQVDGDAARLEQVIANLLGNAIKYTNPGGRIELLVERLGSEAVVRVRDNGIGMAPDMLPQVFELFTRADTSYAREQGGLGIGLSLVQRLVELHGGRVEAHSAGLGQGSEFVVYLPLLKKRAIPTKKEETPIPPSSVKGAVLKILVVDDNVDAAVTLAKLLRMTGHDVQVAHHGPAALETAAAFRPEVMLLDIGMPGMDGYEVARQLRRQPGMDRLFLAALSGYGLEEDRQQSLEAGFNAHLVKPADWEVLQELLANLRPT